MKLTTPSYGEEKTGKATFEVKVAKGEIGPMEPGCNVILYDIAINLELSKNKDPETLLDFYKRMLEMAERQPEGSYYSNQVVKHDHQAPCIIIKKEDLVNQIKELIENHPKVLEAYRQKKQKKMQDIEYKKKEQENLKNKIVSELLDLETSIDSEKISQELLIQYRENLREIESLLIRKFMSGDVFTINGKDYSRVKVVTYARDLLEIVESKIQEEAVEEETKKDSSKR